MVCLSIFQIHRISSKLYLYILDPCIASLINAQKLKHTKIAFLGIFITTFLEYLKIFIEI